MCSEGPQTILVVVSGANGWIGGKLIAYLRQSGIVCRAYPRNGSLSDQQASLTGASHFVHLAALVHQLKGKPSLAGYRQANTELSLSIAKQAALAGVRHFVFCSTAKVMGDTSTRPFTEQDSPEPPDDYARSKWEAEQGLSRLQKEGALAKMSITVLRPPLVYGDGMGANAAALFKWAKSAWPLPFGDATAPRSMISIEVLLDCISKVIREDIEDGQYGLFFVGDPYDRSVKQIITEIRANQGQRSLLMPIPKGIVQTATQLLGLKHYFDRVFQPLQFDSSKFRETYD